MPSPFATPPVEQHGAGLEASRIESKPLYRQSLCLLPMRAGAVGKVPELQCRLQCPRVRARMNASVQMILPLSPLEFWRSGLWDRARFV